MIRFQAKVILYDENDEVLVSETVYGDTVDECSRAAGARREKLERAAESAGVDGANGWLTEPKPFEVKQPVKS